MTWLLALPFGLLLMAAAIILPDQGVKGKKL